MVLVHVPQIHDWIHDLRSMNSALRAAGCCWLLLDNPQLMPLKVFAIAYSL
jgi:hypothetical protein